MLVARLLALALVATLGAGCALNGRTLTGYVDDALVRGAVKRRLATERIGHMAGVRIDTYGGTVYLSGVVDTAEQKSDAEIAAWHVEGVEQVVNDLVVANAQAASASPAPARHPLSERIPGIVRVEPGRPGGPDLAYDRGRRVVATVYTVSALEVATSGVETLRGEGRHIDHVTLLPLAGRPDLPAPYVTVVLWHVSEPEEAALLSSR